MAGPTMEEVYRDYAQLVYRYLFSLCQDSDLAEELTQQTFCEALHAVKHCRGDAALSTFLCGIAKNLLRKERSRRAARPTLPLEEVSAVPGGDVQGEAMDRLARQELYRRVHELPPPMREVVYLRLSGELSFQEIGEILERSETWARVTFYRAKALLQKGADA